MKSTFLISLLLLMLALVPRASAKSSSEITQFGHDIRVAHDQSVSDLTCFGCSIYVQGQVAGDITTFGGNVVLDSEASVAGDVTVMGGNARIENGTKIAGDLTLFGGKVYRQPEAQIAGDVTTFGGQGWLMLIFGLPLMIFAAIVAFIVWLVQRSRRRPLPPLARAA
jgi:predicted acyltransferase (DUF342 family)